MTMQELAQWKKVKYLFHCFLRCNSTN